MFWAYLPRFAHPWLMTIRHFLCGSFDRLVIESDCAKFLRALMGVVVAFGYIQGFCARFDTVPFVIVSQVVEGLMECTDRL